MSIIRNIFREAHPSRRVFDDPFFSDSHPRSSVASPFQVVGWPSLAEGPGSDFIRTPTVHVHESEDGKSYIVEAELPGVKKGDLNVRIENAGRSVTVEGHTVRRGGASVEKSKDAPQASQPENGAAPTGDAGAQVAKDDKSKEVGAASQAAPSFTSTSTFNRTVWLPQEVNSSKVSAKLVDGILTLELAKRVKSDESVKVNIN